MISDKFELLTGMSWEEAATLSNRLFFEADKLDEKAFLLLKQESAGPEVWAKFAALKRAAKYKRAEARREWLRITRILHSLDSRTGRHGTQTLH